jgi:hypothetical protein
MKHGPTLFLKIVVSLMAVAALAICIVALPEMAANDAARHPELAWQQYPFLASAYILCSIFLFALYQTFRLLTYIDKGIPFSALSVRALKYVKCCAITIGALMAAAIATVMVLAAGTKEDITGLVMMGLVITFASSIVATVAAVLQRHVQKAIDIKSENDLTV